MFTRTWLDDEEWAQLSCLLGAKLDDEAALAAARVAVMRLSQRLSTSGVRTFGWKELPTEVGIGHKSAHRRVNLWMKSGQWWSFWDALMAVRAGPYAPPTRALRLDQDAVSALLAELHKAYHFFNWRFTGNTLPPTIAITLERPQTRTKAMLGYHSVENLPTPTGMQAHIALLPERLASVENILKCLLHEMAHLRNWQLGIGDTDLRTRYHTLDFKVSAELFGLTCQGRDQRFGFASTCIGPRASKAISELKPDPTLFNFVASLIKL